MNHATPDPTYVPNSKLPDPVVSMGFKESFDEFEAVGESQYWKVATGMDVLVVDDESDIREMVLRQLRPAGHNVTTSGSGDEAWQMLQKHEYGAIILDLRMPGMDGQALYQRIKEADRHLAARIVFMTGDVLSPGTREFIEGTGLTALSKPFSGDEMRQVIAQLHEQQYGRS